MNARCLIHFDSWGRFAAVGRSITRSGVVVAETPLCYRVRFDEAWPRGESGDVVLVKKWAVLMLKEVDNRESLS